jgi:hypothetical protein
MEFSDKVSTSRVLVAPAHGKGEFSRSGSAEVIEGDRQKAAGDESQEPKPESALHMHSASGSLAPESQAQRAGGNSPEASTCLNGIPAAESGF